MNKKKLLFVSCLLALLVHSSMAFSQELEKVQRIGFGINGLDVSVEIPIAEKITIEPMVGFGPSYHFYDGGYLTASMGWEWALLEPSVHAGIYGKYFYNRDRRIVKGKSVRFNSGHFIGVKAKYVSKPLTNGFHIKHNVLLTNVNWGGQHNIGQHWNYSYSVGVGYGINMDFFYGSFYPAFDLKIAYVLPLKRS